MDRFIAGALLLGGAIGIASATGWREPHNITVKGTVAVESKLYGGVFSPYHTPRPGLVGKIEDLMNEKLSLVEPQRLYGLQIDGVRYDTRAWWTTIHHEKTFDAHDAVPITGLADDVRSLIWLQSETDRADVGDTFDAPLADLGRIGKRYLLRGVKVQIPDDGGNVRVEELRSVLKDAGKVAFTPQ